MADISAVVTSNGDTYNLKDATARESLVPSGGTTGQVLTKTASGYGWADASGGGGGTWGSITGTLSNQTDLQTALDGKMDAITVSFSASGSSLVFSDTPFTDVYTALSAKKLVVAYFVDNASFTSSTIWFGTAFGGVDAEWAIIRFESIGNGRTGTYVVASGVPSNVVSHSANLSSSTTANYIFNSQIVGRTITVATTDWSSTTTTVDGVAYYTAVKSTSNQYTQHPVISIAPSTGHTLPTQAEQDAYDTWKYADADMSAKTITLYSESVPTSDFTMQVMGVL